MDGTPMKGMTVKPSIDPSVHTFYQPSSSPAAHPKTRRKKAAAQGLNRYVPVRHTI
jgi:hypothetical protein